MPINHAQPSPLSPPGSGATVLLKTPAFSVSHFQDDEERKERAKKKGGGTSMCGLFSAPTAPDECPETRTLRSWSFGTQDTPQPSGTFRNRMSSTPVHFPSCAGNCVTHCASPSVRSEWAGVVLRKRGRTQHLHPLSRPAGAARDLHHGPWKVPLWTEEKFLGKKTKWELYFKQTKVLRRPL